LGLHHSHSGGGYIWAQQVSPVSTTSLPVIHDVTATALGKGGALPKRAGPGAYGIWGQSDGNNSNVTIHNAGTATARGAVGYGIWVFTGGKNSNILIENSGSVFGSTAGIVVNPDTFAYGVAADNPTTIINTGDISAGSHFAIDVDGPGTTKIYNASLITGFVDLTEQNDLFVNQAGGTVQAATMAGQRETSSFQGLETFKNAGLISMMDGREGDSFTISNTPGGKDLSFQAQSGSRLAVDAFLGGPGSKSDIFTVDGNVSGTTKVAVNNTNAGLGVFNAKGIRVVNVTGKTPRESNFVLKDGPIDTGLFDYDLFFTPTGSGHWDLKSFAGARAFALPQLVTAAQDLWHQTSATWFDRTADLRVVLNGGGAPAYDAGTKSLGEPVSDGLTPGVWIKGGGSWLDRDASAKTTAYGRNYTFDLDNELQTIDLQVGIDIGQRDVLG